MAYITQQQLVERFGEAELIQLTDRDGSAGAIVTSVLDSAIEDAGSEVDAYVGVRYDLPLATVPVSLVRVVSDIVRYRLYDEAATEQVRKRYEDAIKFLVGVAKGGITIGELPEELASSGDVRMESGGRVFSRADKSFL